MRDIVKASLFCLLAQALFTLKSRLAVEFWAGSSVLGATAVISLIGSILLVLARFKSLRSQVKPKPLVLAAAAGALGILLHTTLDLAGTAEAGASAAALANYGMPLAAVFLVLLLRIEAADRLRLGGLVFGFIFVSWLLLGPAAFVDLVAEPSGTALLGLSALAAAGFLVVAQKLVQTSSIDFAVAALLLFGGLFAGLAAGAGHLTDMLALLGANPRLAAVAVGVAAGTAAAYLLLFHGLAHLKATTVAASWLTTVPLSALYLYLTGHSIDRLSAAAALAGLLAFALVVSRDQAA